jgi:preprotein translocase subunit SecE
MADNTTKDVTAAPVKRVTLLQFYQEVRRETSKVTWPTWKETWLTTVMVFIMVALIMVFFLAVDTTLSFGVRLLLGLG